MLEKVKTEEIVEEFKEAKKLLYAMFGKRIRYVLLTDALTDRTEPAKGSEKDKNRYDIYLTTMRIANGRELDIIGGALHESAHVMFSIDFPDIDDSVSPNKLNLMEDIFVNHKMANEFVGAAEYINNTYDVANPENPANIWEALLSLNQTLKRGEGINFEYVETYLESIKPFFIEWLEECEKLKTYAQRVPAHKKFLDKISPEQITVQDVFSAISNLLGTGIPNQCQGMVDSQVFDSYETSIINSILKQVEDEIERKEEAKNALKGFQGVDYINVVFGDPDIVDPDHSLMVRLSDAAYKNTLANSGFVHKMYAGTLSKKTLHNYGYVKNGLLRPLFKRRETSEIAHFFVLLDGSGSMDEYEKQVKSVAASLAASLNMRYSVYGGIFKDNQLVVCEKYLPIVSFGGGTPAIEAINAAGEILKNKSGKKYIIFISDMEFEARDPEIPKSVKLIKVGVTNPSKNSAFGIDCMLDELPAKLALLIKTA